MAIPKGHRTNFENMQDAARNNRLALMECTCARTGEPRYVICMVNQHDDGDYEFMPIGHMFEGDNPYDAYLPPE